MWATSTTWPHFADRGLVKPPFFVQCIFGILGGIGPDPENLLHMRATADRLFGDDYYLSVLGAGRHQMPFVTLSAILGGNVRVGLEDSLYAAVASWRLRTPNRSPRSDASWKNSASRSPPRPRRGPCCKPREATMSDSKLVELEINDAGVALVRLNRPAQGNALSLAPGARVGSNHRQYRRRRRRALHPRHRVRPVLLRRRRHRRLQGSRSATPRLAQADHRPSQRGHLPPGEADKPVIMAVNGPAAGAGLGLAAIGDIVLVAESAHFTMAYTAIGLTPDGATSWCCRALSVCAAPRRWRSPIGGSAARRPSISVW